MIEYDEITEDQPVVREGRGWIQTTPPPGSNKDRTYRDTAPADGRWDDIGDQTFLSMTAMLRRGYPSDFTGPTKHNQATAAIENWDALSAMPVEERHQWLVDSSDVTLHQAADRGTGVHHYVEHRVLGTEPDYDFIARCNALPWLAAVENFLCSEKPEPVLVESVAFDREHMVAGSVDNVSRLVRRGATFEIDFKSKEAKEKRYWTHGRYGKDATQTGGYYKMLTRGYYMDDRGRRQQLDAEELRVAVVTLASDGTYAFHEVRRDEAVACYELAVRMAEAKKVSNLMERADYSEPFDPNPALAAAIDNVPNDAPEKMQLAKAWTELDLPKPSNGEVPAERFGEAMYLIRQYTTRFQPFAEEHDTTESCPRDEHSALCERYGALPVDIREDALRHATGLPPLTTAVIDTDAAKDWHLVLEMAETQANKRQQECIALFNAIRTLDCAGAVMELLPADLATWTDDQLTVATSIYSAALSGDLVMNGDGLVPNTAEDAELVKAGKREAVKRAKERAAEYELTPAPTKWDDLLRDPVLWAVTVTT